MGKRTQLNWCEVCGTKARCIKTESGMYVCSETCRILAEELKPQIPLGSTSIVFGDNRVSG